MQFAGNDITRPQPAAKHSHTEEQPKQKYTKGPFFPGIYLVMTVTSLALLTALSGLGATLINYWFSGTAGIFTDFNMIYWLASLVVVLPIHLLSYMAVRKTDRSSITTFSLRVSHALLGLYLFIVVAAGITLGTMLVQNWLNVWLGPAIVNKHLIGVSLGLLQAVAWMYYAAWHFIRVRSNSSKPIYYVAIILVASIGLSVLTVLYPAPAYRDIARDHAKERDLSKIQRSINEYVDGQGKLPANLSDLGITDKLSQNINVYTYTGHGGTSFGIYTYTICANFANSNDKSVTATGFKAHGSGEQCFDRNSVSREQMQAAFKKDVQNVQDGETELQTRIATFLKNAKVDSAEAESYVNGQLSQLESYMESLDGGINQLQTEMDSLQGNLVSLDGDTAQLNQDFKSIAEFLQRLCKNC